MIEEFWIIYETKNIFHQSYTNSPLILNSQLFSGFISALLVFSEEITGTSSIKNLEFLHERLTVLKRNFSHSDRYFLLVARSALVNPTERVFQQLSVLSTEIQFVLENSSELSLLTDSSKILDVGMTQAVLENLLEPQLKQWLELNTYLLLVDQVTLINLMNELYLFLSTYFKFDQEFSSLFDGEKDQNLSLIVNYIINPKHANSEFEIRKNYSVFSDSLKLCREIMLKMVENTRRLINNLQLEQVKLKLLEFISKNWNLIKYFQLEDIIFEKISQHDALRK